MAQGNVDPDVAATSASRDRGDVLLEISNALVRLHKRYYGKGPTKARTVYRGGVIVCVMRGGMTTAEQTLVDAGQGEAVYHQRHEYQKAVRGHFIAAIEEITGRKVEAFMSGNHLDPAMVAEVFVLEAEGQQTAPE